MTKANTIPAVRKSWKIAPKVPRADASAISEIYVGTRTQDAPTPIPTINLAMQRTNADLAKRMIVQEMRNGAASERIAFFRPILSAILPAGRAPAIDPIASKDPTQDSSVSDSVKNEPSFFNNAKTGDVHANAVPTPIDNMEARIFNKNLLIFVF